MIEVAVLLAASNKNSNRSRQRTPAARCYSSLFKGSHISTSPRPATESKSSPYSSKLGASSKVLHSEASAKPRSPPSAAPRQRQHER